MNFIEIYDDLVDQNSQFVHNIESELGQNSGCLRRELYFKG